MVCLSYDGYGCGRLWRGSSTRGRLGDAAVIPLSATFSGEFMADSTVCSDSTLELYWLRLLELIGGLPEVAGWTALVDLNEPS